MLQHADKKPVNVTRECCTACVTGLSFQQHVLNNAESNGVQTQAFELLAAKHPLLVQQVLNSLKKDFSTGSCDSDLPTRVIVLCVTKIDNWILLMCSLLNTFACILMNDLNMAFHSSCICGGIPKTF